MKNEVEKRTRKRKSKSKKKYEKKTPRRDAKTSKTKQNAERGDDFRKMHISAQWTNKLRKGAPKSSKNDPNMRHKALKKPAPKTHQKMIAKILKMTFQKVSKKVTLYHGWRLLGHLCSPSLFSDTKSAPKDLPKRPQDNKIDSKSDAKVNKNEFKIVQ